jgi:hypothetical protein
MIWCHKVTKYRKINVNQNNKKRIIADKKGVEFVEFISDWIFEHKYFYPVNLI